MRVLIIGGSDAGISAALRANEIEPAVEITVLMADAFPNYSICGLPFYLSGETPEWKQLAHRTEFAGIEILTECKAQDIDIHLHAVRALDRSGQERLLKYDRLIVATGARALSPQISGLELQGVFPVRTMEDSFRIHDYLEKNSVSSAVVIGSGYIGLEMTDALVHRGLSVTLVGSSEAVLPTVDSVLGKLIEQELIEKNVKVFSGVTATSIEKKGSSNLSVNGDRNLSANGDVVIVGGGVSPDSLLASTSGLETGPTGAIRVNQRMETSVAGVYAAGDCAETWHRVLREFTYLPLDTTSHKQGRIAGENAVGGDREFAGSVGTQVVKVFDLAIARTGLRDSEAVHAGFASKTVGSTQWDHKRYYPGARELNFRVTGDQRSRRLLGAQLLGHWQASVAKRIDVFAAALFHGMLVEDLSDLDLSYTPPLGSPWDAVQLSAQAWSRAVARRR